MRKKTSRYKVKFQALKIAASTISNFLSGITGQFLKMTKPMISSSNNQSSIHNITLQNKNEPCKNGDMSNLLPLQEDTVKHEIHSPDPQITKTKTKEIGKTNKNIMLKFTIFVLNQIHMKATGWISLCGISSLSTQHWSG